MVTEKLILVDENVPEADKYFGPLGRVERFAGRSLSAAAVARANALVVRSVTRVDPALLAGSAVEFVGTCTIGTDHVDQAWLAGQGIGFASAPGCNANSVAEYVLTALAALDLNWSGRRFGIVGCGNVGGGLYRKLQSLGVSVCGYDPLIAPDSFPDLVPLDRVFDADVVCLHAPLTHTGAFPTLHMITEPLLNRLKQGAVLISAGRGPVLDNDLLLQFKRARPDIKLVLDVWEYEPWLDPQLLALAELGTPHIAGYSWDGKLAGTRMIAEALARHWRRPVSGLPPTGEPQAGTAVGPLTESQWQGLRRILLAAYDIQGDDRRLRDMVGQAGGRTALETGFDALRKHYPERREFAAHTITQVNPELAPVLRCLGFQRTD